MKRNALASTAVCLAMSAAVMLSGCQGILSGVYDEPPLESGVTESGRLYIDASDWGEWHYIDLKSLASRTDAEPGLNPSSLWVTHAIPTAAGDRGAATPDPGETGIYTYWYDIFGAGISNREYRSFVPTAPQPEPDSWTFAVHRNNVRTNGCGVAETSYTSIAQLPADAEWLQTLEYSADQWNQTDVWAVRDRMLSGVVGNQGICVNSVLSGWLNMVIPPMPPSFALNSHVFVLRLADGTYAALQLADYVGATGEKCCLTINYKYPL